MQIKDIINKNRESITDDELSFFANKIRKNSVEMVYKAQSGHPGGAMGLADIYAVLYLKYLNFTPENVDDHSRDRFLISNGHTCAAQYAALAQRGFFPEEELATFRQLGSRLQGHPSRKYLPIVENSSGSLGQGLSQAGGVALGLKLQNIDAHTYVCISDGECQEGMTWEAAMAIGHNKLDKVIAFVDYNNIQIDGKVEDVMSVADLGEKFRAFGWVTKDASGHDIQDIKSSFDWALANKDNAPKIIIFKTVLGKGVSFMEHNPKWHGTPPDDETYKKAMDELNKL